MEIQNQNDEQLIDKMYSSLEWKGKNKESICFEKNSFAFQKNHVIYSVDVSVIQTEKCITIKSQIPVRFEILYLYLGDVRRYEYLFDGAFYVMDKCLADGQEVTEDVKSLELGYFQSARPKHKIPLELDDKKYKKYFLRWLKLQKDLEIINQMALFANCVDGITADMRIAMLIECYEALGKKLEKRNILSIDPKPDTIRQVKCPHCDRLHPISIKGKKTLACYIHAIVNKYGRPIFSTEFRRRKSLINHIIKTRNKVFHVNSKQKKILNGEQCSFYTVKLDWMFRYIIWILMGYDQVKLDIAVSGEIKKFENKFVQIMY